MLKKIGILILLLNCQVGKHPVLKFIYPLASTTTPTLTNLVPDSGTLSPSFSEANYSYTMSVGNTTSTISFTPSSNSGNTITVNGSTVNSGVSSNAISLSIGTNTITLIVTSSDGTQGTYTISVIRAGSSNNDLSSLTISSGTLSPVFASATTSYTVSIGNAITSVTVTPTASDATATITVNTVANTSGVASGSLAMSVGANVVTIVVTAQNASTKTYTITVTRAGSSNNDLSSLTISSGTLSPVFAAATTSYTVSIINTVTSVTVTPTASDATATITVNAVANTSGVASGSLAMSVGANVVTIIVTAQDTTTKTYTITITRLSAGVKRIFVTSAQYDGNVGGITGADTKCNADTNKPADGSTYKAILVDGTNREACSSSNCTTSGASEHIDWVLSASTSYVRASDSVSLFTTNTNAIFVFGTMSNSFQSGTQVKYWSGFSSVTLWSASATICTNFTSSSSGIMGRIGLGDQTNYTSLRDSAASPNCASSQHLLCAEQ